MITASRIVLAGYAEQATVSNWPLRLLLVAVVVAAIALAAAAVAVRRGREGRAFAATGLAIAGTVAAVFLALFPDVVPSTLDPRWSLTAAGTASSPYTLTIITWAALVLLPAVVAYQAWTYWVFRQRIGRHDIPVGH